jgi:hypothetical protein
MNQINKLSLEVILENNMYFSLIANGKEKLKFKNICFKNIYIKRIDNCTIKFRFDKKEFTLIETPRIKINFI